MISPGRLASLILLSACLVLTACGAKKPSSGGQSCAADGDCPGGSVCVEGTCAATCSKTRPCSDGLQCVDGVCRTGCTDDSSCGAGQTCVDGACVGSCTSDAACGANARCVSGACYSTSCGGQACAPNEICVNDVCTSDACLSVTCNSGERCANGQCYPAACYGVLCPAGRVCLDGMCADASCVGVTCPSGSACVDGLCVSSSCNGTACATGEVCVDNACVDAACANVTCSAGEQCVQGVCRGPACEGASCATGYICTLQSECRSEACAGVNCQSGSLCNGGQCFPERCGNTPCGAGEVCDQGACTPLQCAGVSCASGEACAAGGQCLPRSCGGGVNCPGVFVCDQGVCRDPQCVNVTCPGSTVCSRGSCWPDGPPGGPACPSGKAFIDGACRELFCEGVTCAAGAACQGGDCVSGAGVYAAGWVQPSGTGTTSLWQGVVAAYDGTSWKKLNQTPLPPIKMLKLSPDATTFYVVGTDGTFYYSLDGATWVQRWQGTTSASGAFTHLSVASDGALIGSLTGTSSNTLGRLIVSRDRGDSWSALWTPAAGSFGARTSPFSTAPSPVRPGRVWVSYDDPYAWSLREVSRTDNMFGSYSVVYGAPAAVVAHPTDPNRAFLLTGSSVVELDGGTSGPFNTCDTCMVFKRGTPTTVLASSGGQVFKSTNDALSWGARQVGIPSGASLASMTEGEDEAMYCANRTGSPGVLRSIDDGEQWTDFSSQTMAASEGLGDQYPVWDAGYGYASGTIVAPTAANGFNYRVSTAGTSGNAEPVWPLAPNATVTDGTVTWTNAGARKLMRVSAVTARSCPPGLVQCGVQCVTTFDDPNNCGGCNIACAPTVGCFNGQCLGPRASELDAGTADGGAPVIDAGIGIGCADGTREGFLDVSKYPEIAACDGVWNGQLTDPGPDALCGAGWHVCGESDQAPHALSYLEATSFPGCFAYRAANDGAAGCQALDCTAGSTHDDIAGMGSSCVLLSGVSTPPAAVSPASIGGCLLDKGIVDSQCCSITDPARMAPRPAGCLQRGESGVVCCHK